MIKASELRLNNLIASGETIYKVTVISGSDIKAELLQGKNAPEESAVNFSYILLNEDLMQKIANNETGNLVISSLERTSESSDMITLSTIECYLHDDGFLRICAYEYDKKPGGSFDVTEDVITLGYEHLRFLHQLQNLYYSLSGKELEVSLS